MTDPFPITQNKGLFMIKIVLLKNYPELIIDISKIWYDVLGKIWMPAIGIAEIETLYHQELKQDLPLTYIALNEGTSVGACTLQLHDDVRPDLCPWIESVVVDTNYQRQGIGKMLLDVAVGKAKELGFKKIYLFAFDPAISAYYQRLGWKVIGIDEFNDHRVEVMELDIKGE